MNYVRTLPQVESVGALDMMPVLQIASLVGGASGAYHGYKRNDSIGWAVGWALLGGLVPIITVPLSLAQGFGKRKK